MNYLLTGTLIGLVMGLTGSGGALVAIPLFMALMRMELKEASVMSLFAVVLAAGINFTSVASKAAIKVSLIIFMTSLLGSYVSIPLKNVTPDIVIALLLAAISLFSLISVWGSAPEVKNAQGNVSPFLAPLTGIILGMLTTLTGLGGGVLLMPILVGPFRFGQNKAVATSLLAIALSSAASLLMQLMEGFTLPETSLLVLMAVGIIIATGALKYGGRFMSPYYLGLIRKIVFSMVVGLALTKIF